MFARDVLPHVKQQSGGAVILSRTLHTFGLGESAVAKRLGDLMRRDRNPSVGTTVTAGVVSLRINARFGSNEQASQKLQETDAGCRAALGDLIYGEDDQSLAAVVAGLLLAEDDPNFARVATAESCTGGLLAKLLTDVPGSSRYFGRGWITYSNDAKVGELGVDGRTIEQHGAVSEPDVRQMAEGARRNGGAALALAISGVAGPAGGTPAKPVGTVCIALASADATTTRTFNFPGDREMIRDRAAKMALTMFRFQLLGRDLPF